MKIKSTVLATLIGMAGIAFSALAAESFEIKVTGTISPSACNPTITGGDTINYGTISPASLSADGITKLPEKETAFTITCDAPAKVALKTVDNRSGTAMTRTETLVLAGYHINPESDVVLGLGTDSSGNKIGVWYGGVTGLSTDTDPSPAQIRSGNNGNSWTAIAGLQFSALGSLMTVSKSGETTPLPFTTLTGKLKVQAVIAPISELDLRQAIQLDGSATIQMVYL